MSTIPRMFSTTPQKSLSLPTAVKKTLTPSTTPTPSIVQINSRINHLLYAGRNFDRGFKRSLLASPIDGRKSRENLVVCTNCNGVMRNASITEEGHMMCSACAHSEERLTPYQPANEAIDGLNARCPYSKLGCPWNGKLKTINSHVMHCSYCPQHEQQQLLQPFLEKHASCDIDIDRIPHYIQRLSPICDGPKSNLNSRSFCGSSDLGNIIPSSVCAYCNCEISCGQLQEHLTICPNVTIECSKCEESFKRLEYDQHQKFECPHTLVQCRFSSYGCISTPFKRYKLIQHNKKYKQQHNEYILTAVTANMEQLEKQNNELESRSDFFEVQIKLTTTENNQLLSKVDKLTTKNEELMERLAKMEGEVMTLKSEIDFLPLNGVNWALSRSEVKLLNNYTKFQVKNRQKIHFTTPTKFNIGNNTFSLSLKLNDSTLECNVVLTALKLSQDSPIFSGEFRLTAVNHSKPEDSLIFHSENIQFNLTEGKGSITSFTFPNLKWEKICSNEFCTQNGIIFKLRCKY